MEEKSSLQSADDNEMDYSDGAFTFSVPTNNQVGFTQPDKTSNQSTDKKQTAQRKGPKTTVEDFWTTTSAHGWGRVAHNGNSKVRLLWLVLTVGALVVNACHISILVVQFLDYPFEQVSQVQLSEINFPSITVCNIQPVSMTTANSLLQNTSSKAYKWDQITKQFFPEEDVTDNMKRDLTYELLYNRVRQPIGFFENIEEESQIMGHQPMDFLLSCTFGPTRCNFDNFTYYQTPEFYNCYTFNGGNTSRDKLIVQSTGPQAGLSLIMYLESDNGDFMYNGTYYTFGNIANAAGVRVTIHPPDTRPSPGDLGFDIPPGYSSSVGARATKHVRLGEPYDACLTDMEWELGGDQFVYSTHACLKQCQQNYVMDLCSCISAELPIPPEASVRGLQYCGHFNPEYPETFYDNLSCEANVTRIFMSNETIRDDCDCESPCQEYEYEIKTSYSLWPLDLTQKSFFDLYVNRHPFAEDLKAYQNLGKFNMTEIIYHGLIRKNFVRLNVYLESLVILEYVQKESYTFYSLWSDIGGTFGLWIGMSILTWGEVLELVITLFYNAFQNRKITN